MIKFVAALAIATAAFSMSARAQVAYPLPHNQAAVPETPLTGVIGNAVAPFSATTSDQAVSGLTLVSGATVCLAVPATVFGGTTANTAPLNVNWAGGNSVTAPTDQIPAGQRECKTLSSAIAPHVSVPTGTVSIGVQQ